MNKALLSLALVTSASMCAAQNAAVVSAAYQRPTFINVAPGQVMTFYVHGIGAGLTKRVDAQSLPLPTTLAGISAQYIATPIQPIPILSVEPISTCAYNSPGCSSYTAVTVQIPIVISAESVATVTGVPPAIAHVQFSENGVIAATVDVKPYGDQIHILRICDQLLATGSMGPCLPGIDGDGGLVTYSDGSRVDVAKPGDAVQIYAVGLGWVPNVNTDGIAVSTPMPIDIPGVSFDFRPNALPSRPAATTPLTKPLFAGLIPGFVGLYQVNVIIPAVPPGTPACDGRIVNNGPRVLSNLTINIIGINSFDGTGICVQPPSQ